MKNQIFNLQAPYKSSPDQEKAISQIVDFIEK
jgi:excinuclease UvrABC helicase subunit UvrB